MDIKKEKEIDKIFGKLKELNNNFIRMSHKKIVIIGDPKFIDEFNTVAKKLNVTGFIVLTPPYYSSYPKLDLDLEDKTRLLEVQISQIELADEIYVLNITNLINRFTEIEIEYAKILGKPIRYHETK